MICLTTQTILAPRETHFPAGDRFQFQFHADNKLKSKSKTISISIVNKGFEFKLSVPIRRRRRTTTTTTIMAIEPMLKANDVTSSIILTSGASGRINALFSLRALKSLLILINAFVLILLFPFRGRKRCCVSTNPSISSSSERPKDEKPDSSNGSQRKVAKGPVVRVPAAIVPWWSSSVATTVLDQDVAARRAIAIRRVIQDNDDKSVREYSMFLTSRGDTLFTQSWTPVSIEVRGLVVLLHGLNEHSGRYSNFAKQLNENGFRVYGMDWIGHGGSDGLHAFVNSLDDVVSDTKSFLEKVLAENPGLPCFCFGHSTGAAIILKAVLDPKLEAHIAGVVLTSPAVGVQPSHPIFAVIAPVFSFLLPKYQFSAPLSLIVVP